MPALRMPFRPLRLMSDREPAPASEPRAAAVRADDGLASEPERLLEAARQLVAADHPSAADAEVPLRLEVSRYTRALRADGQPPERVLALVKQAVEPALVGRSTERREVLESVVRWFVEAYYAA